MQNTSELHQWLDAYSVSHQDPTNIIIHKVCVPTIVLTVFGFLWSIPLPKSIRANFGSLSYPLLPALLLGPAFAFYLRLSTQMAAAMFVFTLAGFALLGFMQQKRIRIFRLSLAVFILAWIGQFIGHNIEGKKPSFTDDLKFLAIGPLWTLASLFRTLGIEY